VDFSDTSPDAEQLQLPEAPEIIPSGNLT